MQMSMLVRKVLVSFTVCCWFLGACSRETSQEEEENEYQALRTSVAASIVATPTSVVAGEKVDLFIELYSKHKTIVDVVAKIHSPDGEVVHVAEFDKIEVNSSSKEMTNSFFTDSNARVGVYSVELMVMHTKTANTLVVQESAAEFTVSKATIIPESHSLNYDKVMHMPGESDPFKNCSTCHGYDLKNGKASNCYTCHNANDHVVREGKVMHKSGSAFTCVTCHGPNNSGGLGPACSECHR